MPSKHETLKCSQPDVGWDPMDMIGHPLSVEDNITACLQRCHGIPGCAHISWFGAFHHCHVSDAFATPQPGRRGFISAPAGCVSGAGDRLDTVTTMLMTKHCFRNGFSYVPWFDGTKQLEAPRPEVVKDVLDCQNKCRQQSWCKKFEYNVFTHMLSLHAFLACQRDPRVR